MTFNFSNSEFKKDLLNILSYANITGESKRITMAMQLAVIPDEWVVTALSADLPYCFSLLCISTMSPAVCMPLSVGLYITVYSVSFSLFLSSSFSPALPYSFNNKNTYMYMQLCLWEAICVYYIKKYMPPNYRNNYRTLTHHTLQ